MTLRRAMFLGVVGSALMVTAPLTGQARDDSRAPLWRVEGAARGTPVHDGDTAYFLSREREVVAIDTASGTVRWRTGTGVTSEDDIFGATTAGTTLVLAGAMVVAGDWDVIGFDRTTGERRWSYAAPDGDGPGLFLGEAAAGVAFAGSPGGRVYAIDTTSGRPRWITTIRESEPELTSVFPPVVHGDAVAIGYSTYSSPSVGGLAMLDAATGRLRWRAEFPKARERWQHTNLGGGPIVVDDVVIGSAGDGNIHALDARTGAVRWTFPRLSGRLEGYITETDTDHRAIVRAGRTIVAGSATGYVVAYDLDTRTERWRFGDPATGSTMFRFAVDGHRVYVPYFGGFFLALDLESGVERWRHGDFMQGFIWPPAPAGDRLYIGGAYGGFVALPTRDPEARP